MHTITTQTDLARWLLEKLEHGTPTVRVSPYYLELGGSLIAELLEEDLIVAPPAEGWRDELLRLATATASDMVEVSEVHARFIAALLAEMASRGAWQKVPIARVIKLLFEVLGIEDSITWTNLPPQTEVRLKPGRQAELGVAVAVSVNTHDLDHVVRA